MTGEVALVAALLAVSAMLQTATGFGFAILSAPVLAVVLGPSPAVSTIVATGVVVDLLVLAAGGTWVRPDALPLLWFAVVLGYLAGRWAFARMDVARDEQAVLGALVVAALVAIVSAVV